MSQQVLVDRLFESLTNGDRNQARKLTQQAFETCGNPQDVLMNVFWPTRLKTMTARVLWPISEIWLILPTP